MNNKTFSITEEANKVITESGENLNVISKELDGNESALTSTSTTKIQEEPTLEGRNSVFTIHSNKLNKIGHDKRMRILKIKNLNLKRDKTTPAPNLKAVMDKKNKVKNTEKKGYVTPQYSPPPNEMNELSYEKTVAENNLLKEEIQNLKKIIQDYNRKEQMTPNIPTCNRFEVLETSNTQMEEEMEYQDTEGNNVHEDFLTNLRRKNNQLDSNNNNKRKKYSHGHNKEEYHKEDKKTTSTEEIQAVQRAARRTRPPPINILYQDPKDTTKLLKDNLKEMTNFYIKRINNDV
ncbi:unnamed protein product [Lasius platythorax]|uniref:Uncharacterized protein n=1 Tax=Lasius platythorax TaxID=488582 RepID=A0AAV2NF29_9HYME